MQSFVQLYETLDSSTKTNDKVATLMQYFTIASEADITWTVALLIGKRPKRVINTKIIRSTALQIANIPEWLFEECYQTVGDLSETISLLLPNNTSNITESIHEILNIYLALKDDVEKEIFLKYYWSNMTTTEIFVFNKLVGGGFRVGVSKSIVIKALAKTYNKTESQMAHLLMGNWDATNTNLLHLINNTTSTDYSKPYPFYLAYALDISFNEMGDIADWQIEQKFDGIRGQLIKRNNEIFVWSRGEELVTDKFPELQTVNSLLPNGIVLDGEILPILNGEILPFSELQKRLGRKNISKKHLAEIPITIMCYDILEYENKDIRNWPLSERRKLLEQIISKQNYLCLSEIVVCNNWQVIEEKRAAARLAGTEGLMLKKLDSTYETGRRRGSWWKWKVEPYTIDAVMLYAQKGHGRRADLFTDYTFAIWDGELLVPFAKAYSGLTDAEIKEVDAWVKQNTKEKFGPVRSVTPGLVFELAFEGIQASSRHKSGVAVRFPRIHRWRKDKKIEEANSKEDLINLVKTNNV
jgi:DNA ligase 1